MAKRQVCIIGYSGHAFVIVETFNAAGDAVTAYCDQVEKRFDPYGLKFLGSENESHVIDALRNYFYFIAIGNNNIRREVYIRLADHQLETLRAIHPYTHVSATAVIGNGTLVGSGAIIQAQAKVGNIAICNTGCIIEHECIIGDFCHIAPGAVLCGNVTVGNGSLVGAGSVINPGITIGSNAIIGAGAVVVSDVPDFAVVAGNPARLLNNKK